MQDTIKQFEEGALSSSRVEADTFQFRYQPYSKPYIQVSGQAGTEGRRACGMHFLRCS